jgi:isobutyryl-CoA mutase
MRSLATRQAHRALSQHIAPPIDVCQAAGFDLIIVESSGIGQADSEIVDISDLSLYVMTPEYGAAMQLEKIDMLDYADLVAINKFDRPGALDALRDVRKQYRRAQRALRGPADAELPVYATSPASSTTAASTPSTRALVRPRREVRRALAPGGHAAVPAGEPERHPVIPGERVGLPARHRPRSARLQGVGRGPDPGRAPSSTSWWARAPSSPPAGRLGRATRGPVAAVRGDHRPPG